MNSETRLAISSEKAFDGELPNSCLSVLSNSLTELCSQGNQSEAFPKTDMEFKSSDVLTPLETPSSILPSPISLGVVNSVCDRMSDTVPDDEVSNYIELYNAEMIRSPFESMKLNVDSRVEPLPLEHRFFSPGMPFFPQNSSPSSIESNFSNPIRDLKSYESNNSPTTWMMDIKQPTGTTEQRTTLGQDTNSISLFAELDHEVNWNNYIFGHRAQNL